MTQTVIDQHSPSDGQEWDCQCARCGSSLSFETCENCGGDGWLEDDDWQNYEGDMDPCHDCRTRGAFPLCLSTSEWCEANPRPGREAIERSTPEWFVARPDMPPHVIVGGRA